MTTSLEEQARQIIDTNAYMVLGTVGPEGDPRVSPVYFSPRDHRVFYWVSSPDATHSHNIAAHPPVGIVIFDSTAAIGAGRAVYVTGTAQEVPDDELDSECAVAFRSDIPGARDFSPEELRGDADLRLYRATATRHEIHVRGGDPDHGTGIDTRREVTL